MAYQIDEVDSEIIKYLQVDGRMKFNNIAKEMGLSETTIRNRVKKLRENKVIQIVAVADPFQLGYHIVGNMKIRIDPQHKKNVLSKITKIPEIWYVALHTGSYDIDVDFQTRTLKTLEELVFEKVYAIRGVVNVETSLVMNYLKRDYSWNGG